MTRRGVTKYERQPKAHVQLTREQQAAATLKLLTPPPGQRERCCADIEQALDKMVKYHEVPVPTAKEVRTRRSALLVRLKAVNAAYIAAGGGDGQPLQEAIEHAILHDQMVDVTNMVLPPSWSRKRRAIMYAHDLLSDWHRKTTISRRSRLSRWHKVAAALLGVDNTSVDLRRQMNAFPKEDALRRMF